MFCCLLIGALSVFGVISVVVGHVLMVFAAIVGTILIFTELVPSKLLRYKIVGTAIFWGLMGCADYAIVQSKKDVTVIATVPAPSAVTSGITKATEPAANEPLAPRETRNSSAQKQSRAMPKPNENSAPEIATASQPSQPSDQTPAQTALPPPATSYSINAPNNEGIVTQGQNGDNSVQPSTKK